MVHVSNLTGDYFQYREDTYEMVGEVTGIRYKLGQKARIRVEDTDRLMRTIDFVFVKEDEDGEGQYQADSQQQEGLS